MQLALAIASSLKGSKFSLLISNMGLEDPDRACRQMMAKSIETMFVPLGQQIACVPAMHRCEGREGRPFDITSTSTGILDWKIEDLEHLLTNLNLCNIRRNQSYIVQSTSVVYDDPKCIPSRAPPESDGMYIAIIHLKATKINRTEPYTRQIEIHKCESVDNTDDTSLFNICVDPRWTLNLFLTFTPCPHPRKYRPAHIMLNIPYIPQSLARCTGGSNC